MATLEERPQVNGDVEPTEEDTMAMVMNHTFDFDSLQTDPGRQEHHEDAIDYEDISDDELPEEEETHSQAPAAESFQTTQTDAFDTSFTINEELDAPAGDENEADLDALFGNAPSSPPVNGVNHQNDEMDFDETGLFGPDSPKDSRALAPVQSIEQDQPNDAQTVDKRTQEDDEEEAGLTDEELTGEVLEQMRLFREARSRQQGETIAPAPAQSQEEIIAAMFPGFKQGITLKFMDLLPSVRAHYVGKQPAKPPKPVLPTKISLAIQHDDEKDFRLLTGGHKRNATIHRDEHSQKTVPILPEKTKEEDDSDDARDDSDFENEDVGGFSWQDFQVVCGDWDIPTRETTPEPDIQTKMDLDNGEEDIFGDLVPESEWEMGRPSSKRRKLEPLTDSILNSMPRYQFSSFHDPLSVTAKIAKNVVLDLNDPNLLVEDADSDHRSNAENAEDASHEHGDRRLQAIAKRYNIANDHEYELLKENHQSKTRNTIGNLTVSHSMPAVRLQWPYYKTMLNKAETRSFHRPVGHFPRLETITFRPPKIVKKKHVRGQEPIAIFGKTNDLSLGDNSHVLLLEYSEQHPIMMSNFGMNSRLINYYRRKDTEDPTRPKLEIGELSVLQPQDVSPLTIFGHIEPGETTPAIYNGMFKAPIFAHENSSTDFIIVRNTTGIDGSNWYLRNIEYTRAVGQQFPSVEVPGPNARKVTTAAKNRLKMVSFRLLRRKKPHRIQVSEITPHILDPNGEPSLDMQNRQKLKEFMRFNKEHKEWEMPDGAPLPDEDTIRTLVSPEDVCLLEAMQVGQQQLKDAGYAQGVARDEDAPDDAEEDSTTQSLEQQLVPWQLTKNFIQAANNKAMLQLHGEGDPTKRGEALNMLKISMKGGFKAEGESLNEKMDAQKIKELGGHSYNVAKQQQEYDQTVKKIWTKQQHALSSQIEPDIEPGEDEEEEEDDPVLPSMMDGPDVQTMRQQAPLRQARGVDDESVSQFSRRSMTGQQQQVLKIVRRVRTRGGEMEEKVEYVRDYRIIKQYLAKRRAHEEASIDIYNVTEEQLQNPMFKKAVEKELARLERNKDRRLGREKQRAGGGAGGGGGSMSGAGDAGSPDGTPGPEGAESLSAAVAAAAANGSAEGSPLAAAQMAGLASSAKGKGKGNTGGTGRRCANCGQVGHIRTNKKLCPMLNGTMKQEDSFKEQEFSVSMANL